MGYDPIDLVPGSAKKFGVFVKDSVEEDCYPDSTIMSYVYYAHILTKIADVKCQQHDEE